MKVLLISTNSLPASPSGPAYVAGAVHAAGHDVAVFEALFATDLERELTATLDSFRPDVVGISIRLVFGDVLDASAPYGTRHSDLRPHVRALVAIVQRVSAARIVLGGPGFNYYARAWLDYLNVDCGIRGEGEEAFPLLLARLERGEAIDTVPGCVTRAHGCFREAPPCPVEDLDRQALPAYDLFDLEAYAARSIAPAIFTKRGCAFACTYCPYANLEGKRYRLKSPGRVAAEIRHIVQRAPGRRIMISDNSFNVPRRHAESICRALIDEEIGVAWGTGDLKPIGVKDAFCCLLAESGCVYANLAIESASDAMLRRMGRGYTVQQVRASLEALSRSRVPFGASLMLGAPGETPATVAETLRVLDDYAIPLGVWVTVGVYLWTDYQDIVRAARQAGLVQDDTVFAGAVYLSHDLSREYLEELLPALRARPGYQVQCNRAPGGWVQADLSLERPKAAAPGDLFLRHARRGPA